MGRSKKVGKVIIALRGDKLRTNNGYLRPTWKFNFQVDPDFGLDVIFEAPY